MPWLVGLIAAASLLVDRAYYRQRKRHLEKVIEAERRRAAYIGVLERLGALVRSGEADLGSEGITAAYEEVDSKIAGVYVQDGIDTKKTRWRWIWS